MEFTAIFSSTLWAVVATPATLLVLAFCFVWWRTRSIRLLMDRIWRLAAGKADIADARLSSWSNELHDVERFQFMYGFRITSVSHIHALLDWCACHAIEFRAARRSAHWFVFGKRLTFFKPSSIFFWRQSLYIVVIIAAIGGLVALAESGWEPLHLESTGTWFLSNGLEVKEVFGRWEVDKGACGQPMAANVLHQNIKLDIDVVCKGIQDGSLAEAVSVSRSMSKWLFIVSVLLFYGFLVRVVQCLFSANAARQIANHLSKASVDLPTSNSIPTATGTFVDIRSPTRL